MKSFYTASLCLTGGYYLDSRYCYGTLADLQRALEGEFWFDLREGERLVLSYGDVPLETYVGGEQKPRIDLMPFVTVRGADGTTFTPADEDWYEFGDNWEHIVKGTKVRVDEEFCKSATLHIDWGAVPILPLEAPILQAGEVLEDEDLGSVRHGYDNVEGGEEFSREYEEELESRLAINPDWLKVNSGAVLALAEQMYASGDFSSMPILGDALEEAGCDNELFLWHCRGPACVHARGSWLVERLRRA